MRFPLDFSKLSFFGNSWGLGIPKKLGIFLGFSWGSQKSGIFLGFFWDFARPLEHSDRFYVCSLRIWMLLLPAIVTHTYNTSERSYSQSDVYKRFFNVCLVTSQSHVI